MSAAPNLPRVSDNDRDEITVTLNGKELRGWSYRDEAERRVKMLAAREFVEGWYVGSRASAAGLRDEFAGQALAGLMGNSGGPIQASPMSGWGYTNCSPEDVAREAYGMADAMIAVREASDV